MAAPLPLARVGFAVCGLIALGLGVYYRARGQDALKASRELETEYAQLAAKEQALGRQLGGTESRISALKVQRDRTLEAAPADAAAISHRSTRDIYLEEATENPAFRKALTRNTVAEFRLQFARLAQSMGWSEEKMSPLADAKLKQLSDSLDLFQAARLAGNNATTKESLRELEGKVDEAYDENVRNLIGADGLQQMQSYDRIYPARSLVDQVASQVAYGPTPFTAAQQDSLTQLLATHSSTYVQGGPVFADGIDWDAVQKEAAGTFSSAQLSALKAIRANQDLQREYRAAAAAAKAEAGAP